MTKTPVSDSNSNRILRSGKGSQPATPTSEKPSSPITREMLHDALSILRKELLDGLNKKIDLQTKQLQEIIKTQALEIEHLRRVVVGQATRLEQLDSNNRRKQAVVFGLSEDNDDNLAEKVQDIVCSTGHSCHMKRDPHRIGKKGSRPRPVRVYFFTEDDKKAAVSGFRSLKRADAAGALKGIYMNYDLPFMTSKENKRLRSRLKELKANNPLDDLQISRGVLHSNGVVIDQFSLENQLHHF